MRMSICGQAISKALDGVLRCAAGHHFRASKDAPQRMIAVPPEPPHEPDYDAKIYPMGEVCPHPNYFDPDDEPTTVI